MCQMNGLSPELNSVIALSIPALFVPVNSSGTVVHSCIFASSIELMLVHAAIAARRACWIAERLSDCWEQALMRAFRGNWKTSDSAGRMGKYSAGTSRQLPQRQTLTDSDDVRKMETDCRHMSCLCGRVGTFS